MGRKPNKQNAVETVEQVEQSEGQNTVETVELIGLQTIVGTGKSQFLKKGSERVGTSEMAMCLIAKGAATLKD